jgi:predicted P-loop ATPase
MQRLGLRRLGKSTVQDAVDLIASENGFHPVREYLDSLAWDGIQRVRGWLGRYLGVEGDKYPDEIGQLFLVALVARIYQPGCQADYVLVLEGPQGAMKSSACRVLAGRWFSDSLPDLTHADPVRLSMHLRGKWLIEIAELASFNASETEIIKAFATRTHETYTPKYGRNEVTEPRQCILIASTNQPSYLHDETGARRFWPVRVGNILIDGLRADRDQLFAEAVHLFRNGARWWPQRDFEVAHIAPEQAARYEEDAWEGAIQDWLAHQDRNSFTITEVAKGAISMELERLGTREQRRIRKVLIQLGWSQASGRAFGRKWNRPDIVPKDASGAF